MARALLWPRLPVSRWSNEPIENLLKLPETHLEWLIYASGKENRRLATLAEIVVGNWPGDLSDRLAAAMLYNIKWRAMDAFVESVNWSDQEAEQVNWSDEERLRRERTWAIGIFMEFGYQIHSPAGGFISYDDNEIYSNFVRQYNRPRATRRSGPY